MCRGWFSSWGRELENTFTALPLAPLIPGIGNALNKVGQGLVDALRTDTRNMYAGAVTLTQPIFMGGKIVAYNKITQYAE